MQAELDLIKSSSNNAKKIILAVVVVDQLTKHWALNALGSGKSLDLIWTLRFKLLFNSGMAFSQGQGAGRLIGVLAILVAVMLYRTIKNLSSASSLVGTSLLIGGAVGNVVDRLFRGEKWLGGSVVDFIDFQWFPVFNVADSAVTVGACLLVLGMYRARANR